IVVVDDASTDGTRDILKNLDGPGIKVILKDKNGGKASAVRRGIREASGEYIIIQDADLEYSPDDYPELLEPVDNNRADAVYGNRFPRGKKNFLLKSFMANKFLTALTNILYGSRVKDMETCYKLIPRRVAVSLNLQEENFNIEPEITAKLLTRGLNIENVPIHYQGRSYEEGKKIGFKDFLSAIWTLFKYRFFT
ncbi:MAG: glycosyltransferase family 2 protein, partial [Elusimicrobiota bacterium]